MSDLIIKDGTGTGNRAEVDDFNRIATLSTAKSLFLFYTEIGNSFAYISNENQILASGGEYHLLWYKNTDSARHFNIEQILLSYNGGDTTGVKSATFRIRIGSGTPSANAGYFPGINTNITSQKVPLSEAYVWTGVGTGMTLVPGILAISNYVKEFTVIPLQGAFTLGYNQGVSCSFQVPEDGYASVGIAGYYFDAT